MSRIGKFLYGTWYGAGVCTAGILLAIAGLSVAEVFRWWVLPTWLVRVLDGLLLVLLLALLNNLAAIVVSAVRKRWIRALGQLFFAAGLVAAALYGLIWLVFEAMFISGADHFADDLEIPADVEVAVPQGSCDEVLSADKSVPDGLVRKGEASLELIKGCQGGIFSYCAWVNPGEPGEVYLRAYEITTGTRLSQGRMDKRTLRRVGWSDDPEEKFSVGSEFTIYEGDWGKYYAARIELWFAPANGGKERKLIERVYKVDGWMR